MIADLVVHESWMNYLIQITRKITCLCIFIILINVMACMKRLAGQSMCIMYIYGCKLTWGKTCLVNSNLRL